MIKKLRKLNTALKELGHRGFTLKLDYTTPKTYEAVRSVQALGNRSVDVGYDIHSPLELEFVSYEEELKVWSQKTVHETEFATLTVPQREENPKVVRKNAVGGTIEITEEFVDLALAKTLETVKEKFRKNIVEEMVNTRLKEAGLV